MPYKDKQQVEFITTPFPKGTKKLLRRYAVDNDYRSVAEVMREGVARLIGRKRHQEAIAGQEQANTGVKP